jgi:pimeloyl-ACP methyl ester carboxylesterase
MTMSEIQTFEPEGRAIPYVDEGTGPAVVLVPGRGLNAAYLGTLAGMLTEADHRIVRVGTRRPSDGRDDTVTLHDLAQDVIDLMDHLGLADAWIGGHAFGGAVARTVSLDHTDRVNGVLLLGVQTAQTDARAHDDEALAGARDADVEALQDAALAATPEAEWAELAPHVPVLVIQGTADTVTPAENGEALRESAPDRVSVVTVEGGAHGFPASHAGPAAWAIEDYLDWD